MDIYNSLLLIIIIQIQTMNIPLLSMFPPNNSWLTPVNICDDVNIIWLRQLCRNNKQNSNNSSVLQLHSIHSHNIWIFTLWRRKRKRSRKMKRRKTIRRLRSMGMIWRCQISYDWDSISNVWIEINESVIKNQYRFW